MISYEIGFTVIGIYNIAKTFLVENFKHRWETNMVANMATNFVRGIFWRFSFLGET